MTNGSNAQPDRPILLKRGVYKAPYTVDGHAVVIAVDSAGNRRRAIVLTRGVSAVDATAELRAWLDDADPVIKLV
jgi:hypothetical protein